MIYFTSDQHYGSKRTLDLSKRPFKDPDQMDEVMISYFNDVVSDYDTIYHLGDFGDFKNLKYIPEFHYFVLGNYERKEMEEKFHNEFDKYREYLMMEVGFLDVYQNFHYMEKDNVIWKLVHEPHNCDKVNLFYHGQETFNLFGHIHGRQMIKRYGLDVGVDAHHFRPISFEDVLFYKNAIQNHYDYDVFE